MSVQPLPRTVSPVGDLMVPQPDREGPYTFEEFACKVPDGKKADLLDGVIHMASPDNLAANRLNVWLSGVLDGIYGQKDLGEVFVSRVAFRLGRKRGPERTSRFSPRTNFTGGKGVESTVSDFGDRDRQPRQRRPRLPQEEKAV